MTGNSNNNEIIINAPTINEIDLTGMLLEKFTPGTIYDIKTHAWIVPEDIQSKLLYKVDKKTSSDESGGRMNFLLNSEED